MRDCEASVAVSGTAGGGGAGGVVAVGLLGPLRVSLDRVPLELTTGRLRTLLAVLAMSAGETVSVDRVAGAMWGEVFPVSPQRSVQTYVTRLRGVLGPGLIGTRPAGYVLRVDPDQVDALRFLRLLDAAFEQPDRAAQRRLLGDALSLWRGDPFEDVPSAWLEESEAPRLAERYLTAVEWRVDLDLAAGRHEEVVAELSHLTARFRLREPLWVRLLVALDRCGRQAEALARYETIRVRIAEELGVDPGPELQQVHADLLSEGPVAPRGPRAPGDGPDAAVSKAPAGLAGPRVPRVRVVPRQLPGDIDSFIGREDSVTVLDGLLAGVLGGDGRRVAPPIAVVHGAPGVGKTAVVVHWAHTVGERFVDGQLFVNLRGFDATGPALDGGQALRVLLDALGIAQHQIPDEPQAQRGLYRSLLADKRMLIILDNAHSAEQVRPLLPGSGGCVTVVTSRDQLPGLVTADGAHPIGVGLLTVDDSRRLLAARLGEHRLAADPSAVREIVERCAGLPLAVAIVAARAATHPTHPLAALAAQLHESKATLAAFAGGDPATDIRAVFSWSYHALSPNAARLFRQLADHPGPDITAPAAASLTGIPTRQARQLLTELACAHVVAEHAPGRYRAHDLLRAYASELTQAHDPRSERRAALQRALDHYLHTADAASRWLNPRQDPMLLNTPQPGVIPEDLADPDQALAWFTAEHATLLAALARAFSNGFDSHAFHLAAAMWPFLDQRGHWHDWVTVQQTALDASHRLAIPAGQGLAHRGLGRAYTRLGRLNEARTHLRQALSLFTALGDRTGQAHTHHEFGWMMRAAGNPRQALRHDQRAHDLYQATGLRPCQAKALNNIGWNHTLLGDHHRALTLCQQALSLLREIGDHESEAAILDSLGHAHHHLGDHQLAIEYYQHALNLFRDLGHRYSQARVLNHLGALYQASGAANAADDAWQQALEILEQLHHPEADKIRDKL